MVFLAIVPLACAASAAAVADGRRREVIFSGWLAGAGGRRATVLFAERLPGLLEERLEDCRKGC